MLKGQDIVMSDDQDCYYELRFEFCVFRSTVKKNIIRSNSITSLINEFDTLYNEYKKQNNRIFASDCFIYEINKKTKEEKLVMQHQYCRTFITGWFAYNEVNDFSYDRENSQKFYCLKSKFKIGTTYVSRTLNFSDKSLDVVQDKFNDLKIKIRRDSELYGDMEIYSDIYEIYDHKEKLIKSYDVEKQQWINIDA